MKGTFLQGEALTVEVARGPILEFLSPIIHRIAKLSILPFIPF